MMYAVENSFSFHNAEGSLEDISYLREQLSIAEAEHEKRQQETRAAYSAYRQNENQEAFNRYNMLKNKSSQTYYLISDLRSRLAFEIKRQGFPEEPKPEVKKTVVTTTYQPTQAGVVSEKNAYNIKNALILGAMAWVVINGVKKVKL